VRPLRRRCRPQATRFLNVECANGSRRARPRRVIDSADAEVDSPESTVRLSDRGTLRDKSVWCDANALSGKHFFFLGLFLVCLEFTVPVAIRTRALQVTAVSGLVLITTFDWRVANRWERERSRSKPS
jgi:hypothetical protein